MVTTLKIMVTMLILTVKLPRASFFRRRTVTPINNLAKHYLTNTFTVFLVPSLIMS